MSMYVCIYKHTPIRESLSCLTLISTVTNDNFDIRDSSAQYDSFK